MRHRAKETKEQSLAEKRHQAALKAWATRLTPKRKTPSQNKSTGIEGAAKTKAKMSGLFIE